MHKAFFFLLSIPTSLRDFLPMNFLSTNFSLTTFLFNFNDFLVFFFGFFIGFRGFLLLICLVFVLDFPTGLRGCFTKIECLCFYQQFITNCLIFFFSFSIELKDFLSINLASFLSQFSYWVKRFSTKLRIKLYSYPYTFDKTYI